MIVESVLLNFYSVFEFCLFYYYIIIIIIRYYLLLLLLNAFLFIDILPNFIRYLKQYGTVYSLRIGLDTPFLVFCDPKSAEFLLTNPKILNKPLGYTFLHNWLGTGLLTAPGIFRISLMLDNF